MRPRVPDGDDTRALHPVATDQPGLILHRPYRKLRQIAIVYALLPLLCAALGGYVAVKVGEANTDRRLAALERDLAERRRVRAQQDALRDAQTRELLRLACNLLDHAVPRDAQVEADRVRYGCTGTPAVPPPGEPPAGSSSPSPMPGFSRTTSMLVSPRASASPRVSASRVVPLPSPIPAPPSATQPGGVLCIDLPLLPPVCV